MRPLPRTRISNESATPFTSLIGSSLIESPLFGNAPDDRILHILQHDWERFAAAAYVRLGERLVWEAAVHEYDTMVQVWYRERGPEGELLLDPVFDLLFTRAVAAGTPANVVERLTFMESVLATNLLLTDRMRRRAEAHKKWLALPKRVRDRLAYQAWKQSRRH